MAWFTGFCFELVWGREGGREGDEAESKILFYPFKKKWLRWILSCKKKKGLCAEKSTFDYERWSMNVELGTIAWSVIFILDQWIFISIQEASNSLTWSLGPLELTSVIRQIWDRRFFYRGLIKLFRTAQKIVNNFVGEEKSVFLLLYWSHHTINRVMFQVNSTLCLCQWSEKGSAHNTELDMMRAQHESESCNQLIEQFSPNSLERSLIGGKH